MEIGDRKFAPFDADEYQKEDDWPVRGKKKLFDI